MRALLLFAALAATAAGVWADENSHSYEPNEKVVLWLNKIGPFHNPQETYPYYSLPFCKPNIAEDQLAKSQAGIGEVLDLDRVHRITDLRAGSDDSAARGVGVIRLSLGSVGGELGAGLPQVGVGVGQY